MMRDKINTHLKYLHIQEHIFTLCHAKRMGDQHKFPYERATNRQNDYCVRVPINFKWKDRGGQ